MIIVQEAISPLKHGWIIFLRVGTSCPAKKKLSAADVSDRPISYFYCCFHFSQNAIGFTNTHCHDFVSPLLGICDRVDAQLRRIAGGPNRGDILIAKIDPDSVNHSNILHQSTQTAGAEPQGRRPTSPEKRFRILQGNFCWPLRDGSFIHGGLTMGTKRIRHPPGN